MTETTTEPQRHVGFVPRAVVRGGYKASTVRFVDGSACCTCTYNYSMSDAEKSHLAARIAASLNLTRHLTLAEIEAVALKLRPEATEGSSPSSKLLSQAPSERILQG